MIIGCGDVDTVAPFAPEIPPLLTQRLPIAESRSFNDISNRLLLLLPFIQSKSVSNLAISVAPPFVQEPCSVSIYETCSIYLRKTTGKATLGARAPLAVALKRILVILAVARVYIVSGEKMACALFFAI